MIYELLDKLDRKHPFDLAAAHCDIPCKIYDPISAQLAVLTMIRMVDLLEELQAQPSQSFEQQATFNRLVSEKELHGKKVKNEINIIWGDYIKQPQLEKHPQLHQLTHSIMLTASKAKQNIDKATTLELLEKVNQFADIFWQTKGVATFKAECPYPPNQQLVYPVLKA